MKKYFKALNVLTVGLLTSWLLFACSSETKQNAEETAESAANDAENLGDRIENKGEQMTAEMRQ